MSPTIHPGEILSEEFLKPLGITAYKLSKATKLPQSRISEIIAEKRSITADTALRLSRALGTSPEFWMNLQLLFDLKQAERQNGKKIDRDVEPLELAHA